MAEEATPVKQKRRGMLAFYVATGVAVALFVVGWFAWTPLKIRYAAYRLEQVSEEDVNSFGFDWKTYGSWSQTCLRAALDGDKRAMRAFMPQLLWKSFDRRTNVSASSVLNSGTAYGFALTQPALLFELLDERSDGEAKKVISDIEVSCHEIRLSANECIQVFREPVRKALELTTRLEAHSGATHREVAGVARHTLAYVRRRFAQELAEAEKEIKAPSTPSTSSGQASSPRQCSGQAGQGAQGKEQK